MPDSFRSNQIPCPDFVKLMTLDRLGVSNEHLLQHDLKFWNEYIHLFFLYELKYLNGFSTGTCVYFQRIKERERSSESDSSDSSRSSSPSSSRSHSPEMFLEAVKVAPTSEDIQV